jgi:hypothetical protein
VRSTPCATIPVGRKEASRGVLNDASRGVRIAGR